MKIELLNEYPYLYETHMHTNLGSACGNNSGEEMAKACKEFGYTGAFITDHNWGGNTSVSRELSWKEWMTKYSYGYLDAKKYGDANDFDVYFGMETGLFSLFGLFLKSYMVDVVMDNLRWLVDHGIHAVVGTSGFDEAKLAEVRRLLAIGHAGELLGLRIIIDENPQDDTALGLCMIASSDRLMQKFEQSGCLIEI